MDQNKPIMKYQKTIIFQIEKIMEHIKYDFQTHCPTVSMSGHVINCKENNETKS